jgi:hypothetical protein
VVAWLKSAFTAGWLTTFADWQAPGGALRHACKMVLEGIVSKRLGSRYRSGRSPDWLKFKNPQAPRLKREAEEDWDHEAGSAQYQISREAFPVLRPEDIALQTARFLKSRNPNSTITLKDLQTAVVAFKPAE